MATKTTKVTLPNGVVVEGSGPEFKDTVSKMMEMFGIDKIDDGVIYISASKGPTPIKEMATPWIKNTICKLYRDWAADLSEIDNPVTFLRRMRTGPDSKTMLGLIEELARRSK